MQVRTFLLEKAQHRHRLGYLLNLVQEQEQRRGACRHPALQHNRLDQFRQRQPAPEQGGMRGLFQIQLRIARILPGKEPHEATLADLARTADNQGLAVRIVPPTPQIL